MPAQTSISTTTSSATTSLPALRAVEAPDFAVAYFVPASWTSTPYNSIYAGGAEDGTTGYVVIEAGGFLTNSIPEACHELATNNVLHPYGLAPRVETATVAGRSSCFVWPSLDGVSQPSRLNGPHFQMAAAVIPYAHSRTISGADTYGYLEIIADPLHVRAIADSMVFLGGY